MARQDFPLKRKLFPFPADISVYLTSVYRLTFRFGAVVLDSEAIHFRFEFLEVSDFSEAKMST